MPSALTSSTLWPSGKGISWLGVARSRSSRFAGNPASRSGQAKLATCGPSQPSVTWMPAARAQAK